MSAESTSRPGAENLQFDRAIAPDAGAPAGDAVCTKCNAAIRMYYYKVDGETVCSTCKASIERANGSGSGAPAAGFLKAGVFGLGAAVAGAIIYYSVMEYLELEIGYVAILIGFMVGYAIRSAVHGRGARKFQLLAAGLTYFSIAMAYAPFAFRGMNEASDTEAVADSATAASGESLVASTAGVDAGATGGGTMSEAALAVSLNEASAAALREEWGVAGAALGFAAGILFILTLPVVAILGSMPSGLISALIIGIGMHQAWNMTRANKVTIAGPFRIGADPSTAAA
jgi:hypothetical protein